MATRGSSRLVSERAMLIARSAEDAFWLNVAGLVPEAVSGDLPVDVVVELRGAMECAVECWLLMNSPTAPVPESGG